MYISKFQVLNYKSYRDSTEIELKRGFNILTGQNSAGKTALLEALALDFKAAPQVSDATVPFRGASPDANSFVRLTFVISGSELVQLVRSLGRAPFPQPNPGIPLRSGSHYEASEHGMNRVLEEMVQQSDLSVSVQLRRHLTQGGDFWTNGDDQDFLGFYQLEPVAQNVQRLGYNVGIRGLGTLFAEGIRNWMPLEDVRSAMAPQFRSRIYRFWAERFIVGESAFGNNPALAPNAGT